MRKSVLIILGLLSQPILADDLQQFNQQSQQAIKEFATTLKSHLVTAMKAGGPTQAITVCNSVAPAIAQDLSAKYDLGIGRTSLKVRNSDNTADQWERSVLQQLELRKSQGEAIKTLSFSETVTHDDQQEMRMMKAIPTGKVCLTCHGTDIKPEVQTRLNELYPDDQATGFALGDIRGAFTVRQTQ